MKKTFITNLPDQTGAFLTASRLVSALGANITRVSYNKAVDSHLLFLEVAGNGKQLTAVAEQLQAVGYMLNPNEPLSVILVEFRLRDVPGAVLPVLELIQQFDFNISYISSQEDGSGYQNFKMALTVTSTGEIKTFLERASVLCPVRIIEYDKSQQNLDNTVFYLSFAGQVAEKLSLSSQDTIQLIAESNRVMQLLEERRQSPYKTFQAIGAFADTIQKYSGEAFVPRITKIPLPFHHTLTCIEPPCGSNTFVLETDEMLLLIDGGFVCYEQELLQILKQLFPQWDNIQKQMILTHPDIDHCGLLSAVDCCFVSPKGFDNFRLEQTNTPNFREQNPLHAPYCRISKILTGYQPPVLSKLRPVGVEATADEPLSPLGNIVLGALRFDFYAGNGGHAKGEMVIVCETLKLVFSGDILVNIAGFSPSQAAFNKLAPYLMTSVNMDSSAATKERNALTKRFPIEEFIYCCGHGALLEPEIIP